MIRSRHTWPTRGSSPQDRVRIEGFITLLAYRSCSPLVPGGHYIPPRACAQIYPPPSLSVMHRPIIPELRHTQECPLPRGGKRKAMLLAKVFQIWAFCHCGVVCTPVLSLQLVQEYLH